jgi:hypothetical protein
MKSCTLEEPGKLMKFKLGRGCYSHPYKDEKEPWDGFGTV